MPSQFRPAINVEDHKFLGLEILRFVSAISVLFWHYQHFSVISYVPVDFIRDDQPYFAVFSLFYEFGYYGVQMFWAISGFIFFWKYRDAILNNKVSFIDFSILRLSRLYPLHFATLIIVALLQALYFAKLGYFFIYKNYDVMQFILQLFLATNWFDKGLQSFNGPIWSISL